ncbi:MAG: LacI family DNA-binding transcriptional regulator, partial [Microbacterium sp.]
MTSTSRATIYDVAAAAQVSIATVSNCLNRPELVSVPTRLRIHRAIDRLGYVPKSQAVSLARKEMRRVAVVAPFVSYASFFERLAGIISVADAVGIEVSVFNIESAATASTPTLANMPIRGQVDGLIVMGQRVEASIETRLRDRALPVVLVDAPSDVFPRVASDDFAGGRMAADHLLSLGHRRLAYLVERQFTDYASQALARLQGFSSGVDSTRGASLEIVRCEPNVDAARDATAALLAAENPPTAIMAHYDGMAIGALRAVRNPALPCQEQIAVMGYDDGPAAEAADLTTVRQPFRESGAVAMRMLIAEIEQAGQPRVKALLET